MIVLCRISKEICLSLCFLRMILSKLVGYAHSITHLHFIMADGGN
jgi:hypothetical protein